MHVRGVVAKRRERSDAVLPVPRQHLGIDQATTASFLKSARIRLRPCRSRGQNVAVAVDASLTSEMALNLGHRPASAGRRFRANRLTLSARRSSRHIGIAAENDLRGRRTQLHFRELSDRGGA